MLRAAVADFAALDGCDVITTRDPRLTGALPGGQVYTVQPGGFDDAFDGCLAVCDAALVVAPEQGGLLAGLVERVERAGVLHLGSRGDAIRIAADKLQTIACLEEAGIPVPLTLEVPTPSAAASLGFPLVLKPRDGAGCVGLRKVGEMAGLAEAWREATAEAERIPLRACPLSRCWCRHSAWHFNHGVGAGALSPQWRWRQLYMQTPAT